MLEDTIIAVSTPFGHSGLGIVRLSGKKALPIAKKLFKPKTKQIAIPHHRPVLGNIFNIEDKEMFEEAYLTYFPAPYTYTTEDVVEFSCHGSPIILEEIVRLGIQAGARHANPGEFTLRAYLGGRIDILQAEAINDLIRATSFKHAKISFQQVEGSLSRKINSLRSQIIHILSQIEASIEFPDEGLKISQKIVSATTKKTLDTVKKLIKSYDLGRTFSEGMNIAITGKTNVGKSTLFNTLIEKDRAIVTPYPGTTRDYLKENLKIRDSIFTLIDMAGFDNTQHPIEKEGIKKGKKLATAADGVLLLLDISSKETNEDVALINKYRNKKTILLFNKTDLPQKMDIQKIKHLAPDLPELKISALKRINIDKLKDMVHGTFVRGEQKEGEIILHLRQKLLLEDVQKALSQGLQVLNDDFHEEMFVEEIRSTLPIIGQLTGEIRTDDILNDIFSRFCIGK